MDTKKVVYKRKTTPEDLNLIMKTLDLEWKIRTANDTYQASIKDVEIKENNCLFSVCKSHEDIDAAKEKYFNTIVGKILVYRAYHKDRKEFKIPEEI